MRIPWLILLTPLGLSTSACSSDDVVNSTDAAGPRVIEIGSSLPPPPESLLALAESLRTAPNTAVVVGVVPATIEPTAPSRVEVGGGLWLDYPLESAEVVVDDDLGEMIASPIEVAGTQRRAAVRHQYRRDTE